MNKTRMFRRDDGAIICQTAIGPETPSEFLLHPLAHVDHWNGPYDFTAEAMAQVIENFSLTGDVVIDLRHETHYGFGDEQAAGWIHSLEARADGLWAVNVEWTELGMEALSKKLFRMRSPVLLEHMKNPYTGQDVGWGLESVALTNRPFLWMPALVNQNRINGPTDGLSNGQTHKEVHMLEKLKKLFGLGADATEDQVVQAVEAKVNAAPAANAIIASMVLNELGLPAEATPEQVTAKINEMKRTKDGFVPIADHNQLKADLVAERQVRLERDAESRLNEAIKAGKLTPAQVFIRDEKGNEPTKDYNKSSIFYQCAMEEGKWAAFISAQPVVSPLGKDTVPVSRGQRGNATAQINEKVNQAMKDNGKLSYREALSQVQRQNPDLARQMIEETRPER